MDSLFKEGKAAMIINGPWRKVKAYKDAGIDYGVALIPDLEEGLPAKPFVGVQGFMINAKSPNKVLAKRFSVNFYSQRKRALCIRYIWQIPGFFKRRCSLPL